MFHQTPVRSSMLRHGGFLEVIIGSMWSGKSSALLRHVGRYEAADRKVVLIKYAEDTRYSSTQVMTHDRIGKTAHILATSSEGLMVHVNNPLVIEASALFLDEAHFFTDLVEFCLHMISLGKVVIVAALLGDFKRVGWPNILELLPKANSIVFLTAICHECKEQEASFTWRTSQEQSLEVIGGADKYMALCGACYDTLSSEASVSMEDVPMESDEVLGPEEEEELLK